jgi:hypothetical protein
MPTPPPALRCVFSSVLERKLAVCECAAARNGVPGQRVACNQPLARAGCGELAALLQGGLRFVTPPDIVGATPRTRVRAAGIQALHAMLGEPSAVPNVHRLVHAAQARYGALAKLPLDALLRALPGRRQA